MALRWLGALVVAMAAAACGDDDDDAGDGDADADADSDGDADGDADACATDLGDGAEPIFEQTNSRFVLNAYPTFAQLQGRVLDRPSISQHDEVEREGACRLLTYEPVLCPDECLPEEACVRGECVPYPTSLSAGELTLRGIGDSPIVVQPDEWGGYYWGLEAEIAISRVELSAAGDAVGPFDLSVCALTAPQPDGDWSAALESRADGEDVTLRWSNPNEGARIHLYMTTGIGTHGGISPVEVECEGPDTGTLTLPGSYLDALYAEGWSCGECGGNDLVRYTVDQTEVDGFEVQLRSEAAATFWYIP